MKLVKALYSMRLNSESFMDKKNLYISCSPFIHNQKNTSRIMLLVILACIPGVIAQIVFFGYGTLFQITLAIGTALLSEALILTLRKIPIRSHLLDNSAILTALLLGVSVPPLAPWWLIVIGSFCAIVIAKQLYGGLGQNPFNPAMIGYVVLLISFPIQMTDWLLPYEIRSITLSFQDIWLIIFSEHSPQLTEQIIYDGLSQATPLDTFKTALRSTHDVTQILQKPLFSGFLAGIGWEWVNLGFLIGGLFMLACKLIYWQIPVSFLAVLFIFSNFAWLYDEAHQMSPLIHLFSGGSMLGAFFIATDPVSASTTPKGRLIYGALIGLLIWLIRVYGGYPDGVAFAILLANITVPLIDHYTKPRVYGYR